MDRVDCYVPHTHTHTHTLLIAPLQHLTTLVSNDFSNDATVGTWMNMLAAHFPDVLPETDAGSVKRVYSHA